MTGASKLFGVNIDLDLNQLGNALIENVIVDPTPGVATKGRFVYNTATGRLSYDDGAAIQQVANMNDVAGLLDFKGGYNATTNTPNLVSPAPGVVKKGDYYVVTVGGTFFTETLEVGDSLFANIDDPSVLADWTIMQANVVYATETIAGVIKLATQAQVTAGTDDTTAVTPLKLATWVGTYGVKKYISPPTNVGGGTPVTFTHNLNNTSPQVQVKSVATGALITLATDNFTANGVDITKNGATLSVIVIVEG
jgi:hypothetical protein